MHANAMLGQLLQAARHPNDVDPILGGETAKFRVQDDPERLDLLFSITAT